MTLEGFYPLKKTALGRRIRGLVTDIFETELELLDVLLESEKAIIDQCEAQLPDLYEGLVETIEQRRKRCPLTHHPQEAGTSN